MRPSDLTAHLHKPDDSRVAAPQTRGLVALFRLEAVLRPDQRATADDRDRLRRDRSIGVAAEVGRTPERLVGAVDERTRT